MNARPAAPAIAVLLLLVSAAPAVAAGDCGVGAGQAPGGISTSLIVEGSCTEPVSEREEVFPSPTSGGDPVEVEPVPVWAFEPVWGVHGVTGEVCVDLVESSLVTVNDPVGLGWEPRMLLMLHDPRLEGVEFRLCGQGPGMPVVVDPSPQVHAFVRTVELPAVGVWVAPGYGLTGMPAYLEVSGQQRFEVVSRVEGFGELEVGLVPVSVQVDWGDGTVERVVDGRMGAPFDGDVGEQISHEYLWPDEGVVVWVTVGWEAVWQVGGFSGVVEGLEVSGQMDLPVQTRRAVRITPDHADRP